MERTMPHTLTDSHAHLHFGDYKGDLDAVISRWRDGGVEYVINVGISLDDSRAAVRLAEAHDDLFAAAGIHPHHAAEAGDDAWPAFEAILDHPKIVAVGETGLDFHRDRTPRDVQRGAFGRQLQIAHRRGLPVIVHCRDAYDECYDMLKPFCVGGLRGVMHCFGGTADQARLFAGLGLLISFAGNVTFPNASSLRAAAAAVRPEEMLIETDCPYLAPQARRGIRNEPAFVMHVAEQIAALHGLTPDDVARITTRNARILFGIGPRVVEETLAYPIRNSLYVNVTNDCNMACVFCPRETGPVVKGHDLTLSHEPTFEELIAAIGDPSRYDEIVFCGFGEPTLRLGVVEKVARWVKEHGGRTRLNTNGLGDEINGGPILPRLAPFLDAVSVSLNAETARKYVKLCRPPNGEKSYRAMLKFIEESARCVPSVTATIVKMPTVDEEACRRLAERLGARLRVREYNVVG